MIKIRMILLLMFFCSMMFQVSAEELTKVGVVDMARVIIAFYDDSDAIRSLQSSRIKLRAQKNRVMIQKLRIMNVRLKQKNKSGRTIIKPDMKHTGRCMINSEKQMIFL